MKGDRDLLACLETAVASNRRAALATIVRARGSTPRGVGTKMVVDAESVTGTIGGGCGEAEVIDAARAAIDDLKPRIVHVDLTEDLYSWSPAICGGVFDVLIEPIVSPSERGDVVG